VATLEIHRANGVALGLCEETLIIYYEQTPTLDAARILDFASSYPELTSLARAFVLVVIGASARTPDASVRAAMQKTMLRHEAKTVALAYTILGFGFSNAAARAVVSGMLLFVKPKYPAKVFAAVPTASQWLLSADAGAADMTLQSRLKRQQQLQWIERFCSPQGSELHCARQSLDEEEAM